MAIFNEDISINSIIGIGSKISGDIKISGCLRIDGDIEGNIETSGRIDIGKNARIKGNIVAKSVTVGGIVLGSISAPASVHLLATGLVLGDIQTHRFQADENALVHGHCISLSGDGEYEEAVEQFEDSKAITSRSILKKVSFRSEEAKLEEVEDKITIEIPERK